MKQAHPTAVHIGADDLPWVDIGHGNTMRVLQVSEQRAWAVVQNVLRAGYEAQPDRHTGEMWAYTSSGAWKYKEYDFVNRANSFVYEPANTLHTFQCLEDDTLVWFHMSGANLKLDAEGRVQTVSTPTDLLAGYYALCDAQGIPRPTVLGA